MSDAAPRRGGGPAGDATGRRRLLFLLPLGVVAAAGGGFFAMLGGMRRGTFDPHEVGAPLLHHPVPDFALPGVGPLAGFSADDLRAVTAPVLVNFFASWCIPCVEEAPEIAALGARLPVWGIAYKDRAADALGFVARTGNPYARVGLDGSGDTAIDWGVTGVPESFLIVPGGLVRWHYDQGPLPADVADRALASVLG